MDGGEHMKTRTYKSGTGWCYWRWTEVPTGYITRLHVVKTPWFALCVHWLNHPDPEPWQHDHPVTFLSVILRGGYIEARKDQARRHRWFNFIRASKDDPHTIAYVEPGTVTLCFMGPKTREWGYHTPFGWMHWKLYNEVYHGH
jgi:hypothetical protein